MKAVLDTNVVVSGIFFGGPPRDVLEAWSEGRLELCLSPLIVDEYLRTCDRLGASHLGLVYQPLLATLIGHGTLVADTLVAAPITADPDDDKFMVCAHGAGAVVVSGDRHLLDASGWRGVIVLTPRTFMGQLPGSRV
ncbi:MAG: PIN domain-containing protein [Longimicrobiales bacterium]|nr:PIN domain-containing protein [Longimicrobiales bacterium]